MNRSLAVWLLLIIVLVGTGIRSFELTARSLWFDEAFSWRLIQFPWTEMITRNAQDVHPPLYYILLKSWSVIFDSSLASLRSFSVVFGVLTIVAAYLLSATATRQRQTGLLAATLIAVSGWQIQFSWEARMYTLGTFLALLSSWCLLHAVRHSGISTARASAIGWWLGYALSAAAFAYVHYYAFFTIAAQAVFVVGYLIAATRGRIGEMLQARLLWLGFTSACLAILLYAPWLPVAWQQNNQVQTAYWIPSIGGWSIPDTFYRMLIPTANIPDHSGIGAVIIAIAPLVAILATWLILLTTHRHGHDRDANWLIIMLGAVPFVLSIVISFISQSLYQDRFFVFAQVFILIAMAMVTLRIPWRWLRWGVVTFLIIGCVAASGRYWQELNITAKPGARAATELIFSERDGDEPIVVSSPFVFFAIMHYATRNFDEPQAVHLFSESGQLLHFAGGPILVATDVVGPEIFETASATLWVVDTTGFGGSTLPVPPPWQATATIRIPEVFNYQGEVMVTKYIRSDT